MFIFSVHTMWLHGFGLFYIEMICELYVGIFD